MDAKVRFSCPNDPEHSEFYLRRTYSEAWKVSAEGGIATQETRNSMDCEGDSDVYCSDCEDLAFQQREQNRKYPDRYVLPIKTPVAAIDNRPNEDLFEDYVL